MDDKGGCCIARCGGGSVYGMSNVDRIMLRFRPIAPKPVAGNSPPENSPTIVKGGRGRRRRYVKYNSNSSNDNKRCNNKKKKPSSEEKQDGFTGETIVTLPLLSETPEPKESPAKFTSEVIEPPKWLSFEKSDASNNQEFSEPTMAMNQLLGSCVTVECVTDAWMDGYGLGCTDEERKMNVEKDTCPCFISDGFGRVKWTNMAYRKMVGHGEDLGEIMVWIVMKEGIPLGLTLTYPAFTCRVKLQYTCGKEKNSLTLPCDVWRMNGGGFAWRLDVESALCLGR